MRDWTPSFATDLEARRPVASGSRRTLIVSADAAWPPISGGDLRNWQNAQALASLGEVLVASVHAPRAAEGLEDSRIRTLPLANAAERATQPRLAKRRTQLDTRIPQIALPRLLAAAHDFKPDTIVVEGISLFALTQHLRPLAPTLVLDMHNIESDLTSQAVRGAGWFDKHFSRKARDARRLRLMELEAVGIYDKVWVCSNRDRERLCGLTGGRTNADVVPNGIPRFDTIPEKLADQAAMTGGLTVLLIGHLNYAPNIEAARRLATRILPKLRAKLGAARLIIAGRTPHASVTALDTLADVELVFNPGDLSEFYRRAHLTIVPLTTGGGTRLKILEAMAWGLPVVATRLAAEGLDLLDGGDISFAESDEELVAAAVALYSAPEALQARRLQAQRTVVNRFRPAAIETAIKTSLE